MPNCFFQFRQHLSPDLRAIYLRLLLSFPLLLISHHALADMSTVAEALQRGDYDTAVPELARLAEKGNAEAQAHLGYLYHVGEGVRRDLTRAAELYRLSAVQGNRDAQYNLAVAYAFGEGVDKDLSESVTWYRRAAEQDHLISQYSLGISFVYGEGVQQDYAEAARWFQIAADKGYGPAQVHLASLYHTGEGVEQNHVEAAKWYQLSAEQGDATAQYNLGLLYRGGKGVDKDLNEARRWLQLAAEQGYLAAQNELASMDRAVAAPEISTPTTEQDAVATKAAPSGGFFSRLGAIFSGKDNTDSVIEGAVASEAELALADESVTDAAVEETTEIAAAEPVKVEEETVTEPVLPEPDSVAVATEPAAINVEESVVDDVALPVVQEPVEEAPLVADTAPEQAEEPAPITVEESVVAAVAIAAEPEIVDTEPEIVAESDTTETLAATAEEEKPGGFFSRLGAFLGGESDTDPAADIAIAEPETIAEESVVEQEALAEEPVVDVSDVKEVEVVETPVPRPEQLDVEESVVTDVILPEPVAVEEEPLVAEAQEEVVEAVEEPVEVAPAEPVQPEAILVEEDVVYDVALPEPVVRVVKEPTLIAEATPVTETVNAAVVDDEIKQTIEQVEAGTSDASVALQADDNLTTDIETRTSNQQVADRIVVNTEPVDTSKYTLDQGRRALLDKDYDQALYHFKPLARAGDTEAQSALGNMYYSGEGVEQDYGESFLWYHLAAEQGNKNAQYLVGNMYLLGEGVKQDNEQAAYWYEKSSAQGHIAAKQNLQSLQELEELNRINENGEDTITVAQPAPPVAEETVVKEEQVEVVDLATGVEEPAPVAETSANMVTTQEQEQSGGFFASLFGTDEPATEVTAVTADPEIEAAIPAETSVSTETTATSPEPANEVEVEDKSLQVETATPDDKIQELITLATRGDNSAQYQLATRYYSGDDVGQDYKQAAIWYRRSADQDNMDAQYSLGNMYLLGEGVEQNNTVAAQWYARAAKQGHDSARNNLDSLKIDVVTLPEPEAAEAVPVEAPRIAEQEIEPEYEGPKDDARLLYELGLAHSFGDGIKQDYQAAFNYFLQSAEQGYAAAQYKTGIAYAYGEGVKQDYAKAAEWYGKAAEQGHMIAQRNLATMYLNGNGIQQDRIKALAWYQVIATSGNAMDVRRRDMLQKDMNQVELAASQKLASQISQRLSSNAPL